MAILIPEPSNVNPETLDWQQALFRLAFASGGLSLFDYTEHNNDEIPLIKKGTRFELNGSLYKVQEDEEIEGLDQIPMGVINQERMYAYAIPSSDGKTVHFRWISQDTTIGGAIPTFQVEKGGYFHPTENWRAFLRARKKDANHVYAKLTVEKHFQYPIGYVIISGSATPDFNVIIGGVWEKQAKGQAIVGQADAGTFATLGATVGAETVTLTTAQMPSHNHTSQNHTHNGPSHDHYILKAGTNSYGSGSSVSSPGFTYSSTGNIYAASQQYERTLASGNSITSSSLVTINNAGSGSAHSNIQPSVVKLVWQRTQ